MKQSPLRLDADTSRTARGSSFFRLEVPMLYALNNRLILLLLAWHVRRNRRRPLPPLAMRLLRGCDALAKRLR